MSKHSEQVMKQRAKLKRVEILLNPKTYETIKTAAKVNGISIAAYIKLAIIHETIYTANHVLEQKK